MTTDNPSPTPALTLSDKLMAMNHLTTFVFEKLDVDAMNYSSWVYYFSHLCHGYGIWIILLIRLPLHPLRLLRIHHLQDAEWTKIDFIIRSWIFSTLAPSLRKRLVDLNPTTAKDAWTYIAGIFQDNKRPRAMALKAELRNLKLKDLSNDGVQNPLVDATSASPMVLLAKSNTSARRGPSLEKVNNPCWSFAKGSCQFGDACKYLHNGVHGKSTLLPHTSGPASSVSDVTRSDLDMLQSLLAKFGLKTPNTSTPSPPVAYTVFVPPGFPSVSAQLSAQPTYGVQYGNGWVIPTGGSVSDGVTAAGGLLSTAGGSDAFLSTAGGSPCTWTFTAASSVYDRGSIAARGFFPWFGSLRNVT
nr:hybrid signal transduction histidine kinase M [Tanacetum cinerariifolium]